jgi:hypothetical protein
MMRDFLHHLFLPRESNNHRARILHHSGLLLLIAVFFVLEISFSFIHSQREDILGIRTEITAQELLTLTNKKRAENGLAPVQLNDTLSNAASQKASDMFSKNYWAHNSPEGTTPWVFIKSAGYDYLYAGENLARGFTTSSDVIDAWMDSPGHRENMLSPNYREIGFAVVPGSLTGDETVLVVEMFGQKREGAVEIAQAEQALPGDQTVVSEAFPDQQEIRNTESTVASFKTQPIIDVKQATKGISMTIILVLFSAIVLDLLIIKRKKIVRVVAHNIDSMIFLLVVILIILIIGNGVII